MSKSPSSTLKPNSAIAKLFQALSERLDRYRGSLTQLTESVNQRLDEFTERLDRHASRLKQLTEDVTTLSLAHDAEAAKLECIHAAIVKLPGPNSVDVNALSNLIDRVDTLTDRTDVLDLRTESLSNANEKIRTNDLKTVGELNQHIQALQKLNERLAAIESKIGINADELPQVSTANLIYFVNQLVDRVKSLEAKQNAPSSTAVNLKLLSDRVNSLEDRTNKGFGMAYDVDQKLKESIRNLVEDAAKTNSSVVTTRKSLEARIANVRDVFYKEISRLLNRIHELEVRTSPAPPVALEPKSNSPWAEPEEEELGTCNSFKHLHTKRQCSIASSISWTPVKKKS